MLLRDPTGKVLFHCHRWFIFDTVCISSVEKHILSSQLLLLRNNLALQARICCSFGNMLCSKETPKEKNRMRRFRKCTKKWWRPADSRMRSEGIEKQHILSLIWRACRFKNISLFMFTTFSTCTHDAHTHFCSTEKDTLFRSYFGGSVFLPQSISSSFLYCSSLWISLGKRSNLPLTWVTKHITPQVKYLVQGASNASHRYTVCLEEAKLLDFNWNRRAVFTLSSNITYVFHLIYEPWKTSQ